MLSHFIIWMKYNVAKYIFYFWGYVTNFWLFWFLKNPSCGYSNKRSHLSLHNSVMSSKSQTVHIMISLFCKFQSSVIALSFNDWNCSFLIRASQFELSKSHFEWFTIHWYINGLCALRSKIYLRWKSRDRGLFPNRIPGWDWEGGVVRTFVIFFNWVRIFEGVAKNKITSWKISPHRQSRKIATSWKLIDPAL